MTETARQVVFFEFPAFFGSLVISETSVVRQFEAYPSTLSYVQSLAAGASAPEKRPLFAAVSFSEDLPKAFVQQIIDSSIFAGQFDLALQSPTIASETHCVMLAESAHATPTSSVLVTHDAIRRGFAHNEGFGVTSELSLVPALLRGEPLRFVRVCPGVDDRAHLLANIEEFAVHYIAGKGRGQRYGIASDSAIAEIERLRFKLEVLGTPEDAARADLYLIRNGYDKTFVEQAKNELPFALPTDDGLIIAVPDARLLMSRFHPSLGAHGHTRALGPTSKRATQTAAPVLKVPHRGLTKDEVETVRRTITPAGIREEVDPLIGAKPLLIAGAPQIKSRNCGNRQNDLAVDHVAARLATILGIPVTPEKIRLNSPCTFKRNVVAQLTGAALPNEIVLIGAHIDSVATDTGPDKAPGADDDASGVAGVLVTAQAIKALAQSPPKRTIRFVLFNTEEAGMAGSTYEAYKIEKVNKSQVVAMIQMDMIGYTREANAPRIFEIHAPGTADHTNQKLVTEAQRLARILEEAQLDVVPTELRAQIYPGGCDEDIAEGSSDHASFLARQWPACLVAEDYWHEICHPKLGSTKTYTHDGYHSSKDTVVHDDYAADIARVVAAAGWMIANG